MKRMLFVVVVFAVLLTGCKPALSPTARGELDEKVYEQFERELEEIRQELKIPGLSAAIVKDQKVVWARGFGYSDLENQVEATPDTPYRLASVTKPIAATLIMQLVEEGLLDLEEPVSKYGIELKSEGVIQVYHLLTHTSEGVPGTKHSYNGARYGMLGQVIEGASGRSFGELLSERILEPLEMTTTAASYPECALDGLENPAKSSDRDRKSVRVNRELAQPYQLDPSYQVVAGGYPTGFSPAAGLISTAMDLAKFDIALDQESLLDAETVQQMTAPAFSTYGNRSDLTYGLGWYAQQFQDTRLVWHSGRWSPSVSSLYLKVPDLNLTFIVLANSTYLNTPYPFGQGDALYCTPALAFYKHFVFPQQTGQEAPAVDWESGEETLVEQLEQITDTEVQEMLARELWSVRQMWASTGRGELADDLYNVHSRAFSANAANSLDVYRVNGVDYRPVPQAQAQLDEKELSRLAGTYVLTDLPDIEGADLPLETRIEARNGRLVGVDGESCISLVALTATRFGVADEPGLEIEFQVEAGRATSFALVAGGLRVEYVYKGQASTQN